MFYLQLVSLAMFIRRYKHFYTLNIFYTGKKC